MMTNYFTLFELPVNFDVDLEDIERKYLAFQQAFHPDNAALADVEKSIAINEAYKVLTKPLSRASHILQLHDIDLEDDLTAPKPDLNTLEEILDLQERVAEIAIEQVPALKKRLEHSVMETLKNVVLKINEKQFDAAAQDLMKAKYFDKTLKDLKEKKRRLNS